MASPMRSEAQPARSRLLASPEFLLVVALAALTRFWHLFSPNAVVFDELHYERYASHYFTGTFYFDVHPPLAKLLYAGLAKLLSIPAATLIHLQPAPALRVLPALCGTVTVALAYVILRQIGASRAIAALAGLALALENALIIDSRLILLEPLLICFAMIAVACYLAARARQGPSRWLFIVASGFASGCAVSVKWTGLSALGLILATWLYDVIRVRRLGWIAVIEAAVLTALTVLVYVVVFAIHFALLPRANEVNEDNFMSTQFRATLAGDVFYSPNARMSLFARLRDMQGAIDYGNRELENATHPGASRWYTWPIMKHPIALYIAPGTAAPGMRQPFIVLLGNPLVWWWGLAGLIAAVLLLVMKQPAAVPYRFPLCFLLGGYAINYVPFMAITRLMYLYHYLFALIWIAMLAALSIGVAARWTEIPDESPFLFPSKGSRAAYWLVAALIVVGFVYFSPFTYGFSLSGRSYDQHFWVLHPHV